SIRRVRPAAGLRIGVMGKAGLTVGGGAINARDQPVDRLCQRYGGHADEDKLGHEALAFMTEEFTPPPAVARLRSKWDAGEPVFGLWGQIPASFIAELAANVGYDYVCVDLQHGLADERAMVEMF